MGNKAKKLANKHIKTVVYATAKAIIAKFKPTILALVFLLVSGYIQNLVPSFEPDKCGTSSSSTVSVLGLTSYFAKETLQVGERKIDISLHAAQRMVERSISTGQIQSAVRFGQIFAYRHSDKLKIGYYYDLGKLFIAVDQRHQKILTVIGGVPAKYMEKLIQNHK